MRIRPIPTAIWMHKIKQVADFVDMHADQDIVHNPMLKVTMRFILFFANFFNRQSRHANQAAQGRLG